MQYWFNWTWLRLLRCEYLAFWPVSKRCRVLSHVNLFFEWIPVTHSSLKTWWLWMNMDLSFWSRTKKFLHEIENWYFSCTKECTSESIMWKDHVVLFLVLWTYNYDWLPGNLTNHHRRLLLGFADQNCNKK